MLGIPRLPGSLPGGLGLGDDATVPLLPADDVSLPGGLVPGARRPRTLAGPGLATAGSAAGLLLSGVVVGLPAPAPATAPGPRASPASAVSCGLPAALHGS